MNKWWSFLSIPASALSVVTPANAQLVSPTAPVISQFNTNNVITTGHVCGSHAFKHNITSATDTQVVAGVTGKTIYVCTYYGSVGATATNVTLEQSASTACTSPTTIDSTWYSGANSTFGVVFPFYQGLETTVSGDTLCVNTSAAGATDIAVSYDQY